MRPSKRPEAHDSSYKKIPLAGIETVELPAVVGRGVGSYKKIPLAGIETCCGSPVPNLMFLRSYKKIPLAGIETIRSRYAPGATLWVATKKSRLPGLKQVLRKLLHARQEGSYKKIPLAGIETGILILGY